ncbi:MAG: glycosyltransferase [Leptospirales bacterium]
MKVAVVHEWLTVWAGAERVLGEILDLLPQADLFVLFDRLPPSQRGHLPRDPKGETFLGAIPGIARLYRNLLPLMPSAIESLDLAGYDLVLSSSHAVAKGILPRPGQLHLCYCHTPPRYLWDMTEAYFSRSLGGRLKRVAASLFLPALRRWDRQAGQRPSAYMANSRFVADRIERLYGRSSTVVYPPVDVERFSPKTSPGGDCFVTMGRLVPYKNIGRIAEAFAGLPHRLVVVGDGPGARDLERILRGRKNVEWLRRVSDFEWAAILAKARAFLFMAEEDFGIAPVEAQAAGVPVIAWGRGGVLETVRGGSADAWRMERNERIVDASGLFYGEPTPDALREAIGTFETLEDRFDPRAVRRNAEQFSREIFRERYGRFVKDAWGRHEREELS